MFDKYNQTKIGEGEECLLKIHEKMASLTEKKPAVQIDATWDLDVKLPFFLIKEIEEVAEVFWKLFSEKKSLTYIHDYHSKFLEKYGISRLVPILELVDSNNGLGYPEYYGNLF